MGRFTPAFLSELRDRVPLPDIVRATVELKPAGQNELKGLCPFHSEKTPSFTVFNKDGEGWRFHCFGCGEHGDVVSWVMRAEKTEFLETVEKLARKAGMDVPHRGETERSVRDKSHPRPGYRAPATPHPKLLEWFAGRGISEATVRRLRISAVHRWMPGPQKEVPVIAFPYYRNGECVNVKYRSFDKGFAQEKDAEKIWFNLDAIAGHDTVYIVEGEMDAASLVEAGIESVISAPDGAPGQVRAGEINPSEDVKFQYVWNCLHEMEGLARIVLACDADAPGQALHEELARRFGKERCWRVRWPALNDVQLKDANEVLVHEGADVLRECLAQAEPYPVASIWTARDFEDEVLKLYRHGREKALSTGWPTLDQFYRIVPGLMSIVTGAPSSGKSEFVDALMVNLAEKYDWKFAICSFENPAAEHIAKLLEKRTLMPFFDNPRRSKMGEGDLQKAYDWVQSHFFFVRFDDEEPATMGRILESASTLVTRYGVRGLLIDPYNEMDHERPERQTETEYVSQILSRLRKWCAAHAAHAWFVAHPAKLMRGRDGKYPRPTMWDISGSANWRNKADFGVIVHREFLDDETREVSIFMEKVRFKWMGRRGETTLMYDPDSGRYDEKTRSDAQDRRDLYG